MFPNERELRIALRDKDSSIERLAHKLLKETKSEKLILKMASEGFIVYDRDELGSIQTQQFPALCVNPLDVAGAGDSLLAVVAASSAGRQRLMVGAALGCCMAGLAVETMGNTPITAEMLEGRVNELFGVKGT